MNFVPLRAGPLTLALDRESGAIRYLFAGPHEVLRAINAPVRDAAWRTIQPEVSALEVTQQADSFRVTFHVHCRSDVVDFHWTGRITGAADGFLEFTFDGKAQREFPRNRIGFCVLHPASSAGCSITVEHTDGSEEQSRLPDRISPHQPFFDIRTLTHAFAPGLRAQVGLEGDTFEMEDQRNWTDASFKTYCTPLALPRPVMIAAGTRIRQRVTVRLLNEILSPALTPPWGESREVRLDIGPASTCRLPPIGTLWRAEITRESIAALRPLRLGHLRIDLWLTGPRWREQLQQGVAAAVSLDAALELAIQVGDSAYSQLCELRDALLSSPRLSRIARWIVFHEIRLGTPPECIVAWRDVFAATPFLAPVGGGATDNFTELNRGREIARVADFTVHACNPQVHAFDDLSCIETLAIQGQTVAAAREFSHHRPVVVSPITFTPRNTGAAAELANVTPMATLPFRFDARLATPFAAAWSLGSVSALATAGAASLTYFEAAGANGLLGPDGLPRPVHRLFELLASFANARVYPVSVSHSFHVAALALETDDRRAFIVATFGQSSQGVRVTGAWGEWTSTAGPVPTLSLCS
jgi:D-apionolactonase